MARINKKKTVKTPAKRAKAAPKTHEGAPADLISDEMTLRRSIMSCLLWEKEFYEEGEEIAIRIAKLSAKLSPITLSNIAIEAREKANMRHAPLVLLSAMAKSNSGNPLVGATIGRVIQRPDEMTEFLAIHAKINNVELGKIKPVISAQIKKGINIALPKFDEYQLQKYNRAGDIKLRDVIRLCHPKAANEAQEALWRRLLNDELKTPDTWEVSLSAGKDKKQTFERLLEEGKLGYLALLRNLRNMAQAGVDQALVKDALLARRGAGRVLPFRYVAAARAAPQYEPWIDQALISAIDEMSRFSGQTFVLVDVSGSMDRQLSAKSDLTRVDAAAALAAMIPGDVRMFSFSSKTVEVPARRGMAGVDAILRSQIHGSTFLGQAVDDMNRLGKSADRLIVISDEQSHDRVNVPKFPNSYMINVASSQNGVSYRDGWTHIDGFSESVLRYISAKESTNWGNSTGAAEEGEDALDLAA